MEKNKIIEHLHTCNCTIMAAEQWQELYKKDKKLFNKLIDSESRMDIRLKIYFKELAERAAKFVDWIKYYEQSIRAVDFIIDIGGELFDNEEIIIENIMYDGMIGATYAGAAAQQTATGINLGVTELSDYIMKSAKKQGSKLVKDINDTTRTYINQSIQTSIDLGEDVEKATNRLKDTIENPKRAELIARTESVRAYNNGTMEFAKATGAKYKVWHSAGFACSICAPLNLKKVKIDELFDGQYSAPPDTHPNCRCGISLDY
jgi:hypothetical protein